MRASKDPGADVTRVLPRPFFAPASGMTCIRSRPFFTCSTKNSRFAAASYALPRIASSPLASVETAPLGVSEPAAAIGYATIVRSS